MTRPPHLAPLLCVLLAGCTDNVAFLSLDITAPVWSPAIICPEDPRRASTIRVSVDCGDDEKSESFDLDSDRVALSGVPLGAECTIEVLASNKYGRVVASGDARLAIVQGENEPRDLPLVRTSCDISCDADGDGLAKEDEEAVGLNPSLEDTDRDGHNDGVELLQCCSDPLRKVGDCPLLIEDVIPPLGVVGGPVVVKASTDLDRPTVTIGEVALDIAVVDAQTVFGSVAEGSVLGQVKLRSGNVKPEAHTKLFAVLRDVPQAIYAIDQAAGATGGLLQNVVDIASTGQLLLLLGQSSSINSANGSVKNSGVLILVDRAQSATGRVVLSASGRPLALGVGKNIAAALVTTESSATLVVLEPQDASLAIAQSTIKLPQPAGSFLFEPDSKVVQVLLREGIGRIDLETGKQHFSPFALPAADTFFGLATRSCTGLAYDAERDYTYVACNFTPRKCDTDNCPPFGALLRFGQTKKCLLPLEGSKRNDCWAAFGSLGRNPLLGAPVIDRAKKMVYMLSTVGIMAAPLDKVVNNVKLDQLRLPIPFAWQGEASPRPMVLTASGELFVAAGPIVHRFFPRQALPYDRPFVVGDGHKALLLAATPDGAALEVIRHKLTTEHMIVCLKRCPTCLCR